MSNEKKPVGYKKPPAQYRFPKGQSGNPRGRPKAAPDFFEDAAVILSAPVTGNANGKKVTLPVLQAVFRSTCRNALKGDNAALRRVVDLILTLEPEARQQAEQNARKGSEVRWKLMRMAGLDPDAVVDRPKAPNPRMDELKKRADALAKDERKRLIHEAKRRR
jgi:hypothetical protein